MSSFFAAIGTAGNALDVLQRAIGVVQNNVANASTPGYVTQTLQLNSNPFDPANGQWGGVSAGDLQSARSSFAEGAVWAANTQVGAASEQAASLQALQSGFDVSGTSGIPGALGTLYSAFSAWSTTPTSPTAQQQVLAAAQGVAQAFSGAAAGIETVRSQAAGSARSTVDSINQLSAQIATINGEIRSGNQNDAGLGAQLYSNLESLSNLVGIKAQTQSDGTVSVLMDGQIPLVVGQTQTQLSVANAPGSGPNSNAPPGLQILTSGGQDVTGQTGGGQLAGALQITNTVIPSLVGDSHQQGSLNQLAQAVADRVNGLLTSGTTTSGAAGVPLFSYTSGSATSVAGTLNVSSGITGSQLAAVDPGPPAVANGVADQLAQLQNPASAADMVNGLSYTDFYSSVASNVGSLAAQASQAQSTQTQVLTQAQNARAQLTGVSLNDQAAALVQFQSAYQASAEVLTTIDHTIQYLMTSVQSLQ